ncbi:MAG: ribosome biogenesis GTPase YlqF [Acetatifactor sp.]|nr:ribosome biogenesis GTPase YlqF [Acetatifactor sp.]
MSEEKKSLNWYPGHMTKARRMMQESMVLIDLVIEVLDARIPYASRNPDIDELAKGKSRIILLNKSDLADPKGNQKWIKHFEAMGAHVLEINAKSGAGVKNIRGLVEKACKEKIERDRRRGIVNRPIRAMVVGIPNVGKSTFINAFAGKACTKTGNKPGVTKGKQWIRMGKNLELLDTPGILWPKFEDREVGIHLAFIGSMNDEIIVLDDLALELIGTIQTRYPGALSARYEIEEDAKLATVLERIAQSRGCFSKGGELDLSKAASILIEDFRSGRIGRMTLEDCE